MLVCRHQVTENGGIDENACTSWRFNDPELLVDFIISLDGYASAEGWPGWWGLEGPEYLRWLEEQPENDYTMLMGARTYRQMAGFAAQQAESESTFTTDEEASIGGVAKAPKVVFSSTLKPPFALPNTEVVNADAVETVAEMKRSGTKSLRTLGSLSLCRSLMAAGLVDRFRVVLFPVITGKTGSERIYDHYPDVALELVESRTFDGRLQLLEYIPTVLTGPPGAPAAVTKGDGADIPSQPKTAQLLAASSGSDSLTPMTTLNDDGFSAHQANPAGALSTDVAEAAAPRRQLTVLWCFAIGVVAALVGILPWLVTGMRLPLEKLWGTSPSADAMPEAVLPFSQYMPTLIFGLIVTGSAIAGVAARATRSRHATAWPPSSRTGSAPRSDHRRSSGHRRRHERSAGEHLGGLLSRCPAHRHGRLSPDRHPGHAAHRQIARTGRNHRLGRRGVCRRDMGGLAGSPFRHYFR